MTNQNNVAQAEKLIAEILKPAFSMHEAIARDLIAELNKHDLIAKDTDNADTTDKAEPAYVIDKLPAPDRQGKWWPLAGPIGNIDTCNDTVILHSARFAGGVLTLDIAKAQNLALILLSACCSAEHFTTQYPANTK